MLLPLKVPTKGCFPCFLHTRDVATLNQFLTWWKHIYVMRALSSGSQWRMKISQSLSEAYHGCCPKSLRIYSSIQWSAALLTLTELSFSPLTFPLNIPIDSHYWESGIPTQSYQQESRLSRSEQNIWTLSLMATQQATFPCGINTLVQTASWFLEYYPAQAFPLGTMSERGTIWTYTLFTAPFDTLYLPFLNHWQLDLGISLKTQQADKSHILWYHFEFWSLWENVMVTIKQLRSIDLSGNPAACLLATPKGNTHPEIQSLFI